MRRLRSEVLKGNVRRVKGILPVNVAECLLNRKRKELLEVEMRRNITILIEGDAKLQPGESRIVRD
jgi:ribonuclease E